MAAIPSFRGSLFFLSNFYLCSVIIDGVTFPSAEHAYVYYKIDDKYKSEYIEVMSFNTPAWAKHYGRKHQYSRWTEIKRKMMFRVVESKFHKNPKLMKQLLETDDTLLTEKNLWHDTFWGKCYCPKHKGEGLNELGLILQEVKLDFQNNYELLANHEVRSGL